MNLDISDLLTELITDIQHSCILEERIIYIFSSLCEELAYTPNLPSEHQKFIVFKKNHNHSWEKPKQ